MKNYFDELVVIADSFDQRGLHEEAGLVDLFLYKKGSAFSLFEKEAVRSVTRALNELSKYSLISTPNTSAELLLSPSGKRAKLEGTVAEQYLQIYEWLGAFMSEVVQPNAELVPDNETYQTLLEFSDLLRKVFESQHSRLSSVKGYYDSFKDSSKALIEALNSLTINPNIGDKVETTEVADKLDEIKQEYFTITTPLRNVFQKGNINLTDFKGAVDNLIENMKMFLAVQGEKKNENALRSLFEESKVIGSKKPETEEKLRSFNWIVENANQAGPKAEKMVQQWRAFAEFRDEFKKQKNKSYIKLETLLKHLQARYIYWMNRFKVEGVEEYNVESIFDKYHGFDNFVEKMKFALEVYSPERVNDTVEANNIKGLRIAQTYFSPVGENDQLKEIEQLATEVAESRDDLEESSKKWEKAVEGAHLLFQKIDEEVRGILITGRVQKDWDLFKRQVNTLISQLDKQLDLIIKNNDKIVEAMIPKFGTFDKVTNVLFKY